METERHKRHIRWHRLLAGFLAALCVAGCSATATDTSRFATPLADKLDALVPTATPRDAAVHKAVVALQKGDYSEASRRLNMALDVDPQNASLHFLNGLAYHLLAKGGDPHAVPLAETGYLLALHYDASNTLAAYQLGLLYQENRHYDRAESVLATAIVHGDNSAAAYEALAVAAYYARDLKIALWAVSQAKRVGPAKANLLRTATLVETIAGRDADAARDLDAYAAAQPSGDNLATLKRRLDELRAGRQPASAPVTDAVVEPVRRAASAASPLAAQLAQADIAPALQLASNSSPTSVQLAMQLFDPGGGTANRAGATAPAGVAAPGAAPAPGAAAIPVSAGPGPALPNWFDCGGTAAQITAPAASTASSSSGQFVNDQPLALPALPSPCKGAGVPKMAVVDIQYIGTLDSQTSSQGVNFLNGLQAVLTGSVSNTITAATAAATKQSSAIGYGAQLGTITSSGVQAGLQYSLNMANAVATRAEVLSRPTLLALDRAPSQFFSGNNLSIITTGQYGGSVIEEPVGTTLSITPTFIDDESMLMSVKVSRSEFAPVQQGSGNIGTALQTTRNMAIANAMLKFGQTLIISGLNEQENVSRSNRVPGLGSLPGLEYLFGNRQTENTNNTLIILVTPRPAAYGDQVQAPKDGAIGFSLAELRRRAAAMPGFAPPANADAIAQGMAANGFYLAARTGDVMVEPWSATDALGATLAQALRLLYF